MAPGPLAQVLCRLPKNTDPNLLSAEIPFADAGVYRISEDTALVQSLDFFTPVVNDPANFGRIAAANALSDIYAMGGRPVTALNLVGFPCSLDPEILVQILNGGAEKVGEAGATVAGGHTVEDDEPKYGLAVTGLVDPRKMITTLGVRPGDRLVLTKPLGTGILTTALKGDILTEDQIADAVEGMCTLNRSASEAMIQVGVSACTDVTGFGFLGHALEMAEASKIRLTIEAAALPVYPQVHEMIAMGLIPAGSYNNREFYLSRLEEVEKISAETIDLLADPQTSGGLLIAVGEDKLEELVQALRARGCGAFCVGHAEEGPPGTMRVV